MEREAEVWEVGQPVRYAGEPMKPGHKQTVSTYNLDVRQVLRAVGIYLPPVSQHRPNPRVDIHVEKNAMTITVTETETS